MRNDRIKQFEEAIQKLFDNFFNILNEIDIKNEAYEEAIQSASETLKLLDEIIIFEKKGDWR